MNPSPSSEIFVVNSNGTIKLKMALDYERNNFYVLYIKVNHSAVKHLKSFFKHLRHMITKRKEMLTYKGYMLIVSTKLINYIPF